MKIQNAALKCMVTIIAAGLSIQPALAATGDHGLPGDYLSYDVGARAAGMGGAMAGLADDVSAIFYNPAGLAAQNPVQFSLQHVMLFSDTMYDFLGFGMPLEGIGNIGIGAVVLYSGNFDVRDVNYQKNNNVTNSMYKGAVNFSYARDVMVGLSAGANLKVCNENIFGHTGTGVGIDIGGLYSVIPEFQVGLFVNNALSPNVLGDTYAGQAIIGLGGRFFNDAWLLDVDVSKSFANQGFKWKAGTQVDVYESMAFVRGGVDDELRFTGGVGGKYMNASLDYAISVETLGLTHKVSLGYSFGGYEVKVSAAPKIFSPVGIKKSTTLAITATSKYTIQSWELNIKDQNGDVIKSFSGEDNPPNQVVWNGKDDRGLPAADGNFFVQLLITDVNGKVTKSNVDVVKIQSAVPLGEEQGLELQ